jgi:putative ABC transport system permease protein
VIWSAHVGIAVHGILIHGQRSALTVLGIAMGVAALITMLAVGNGAEMRIAERIASLGANLLLIRPGTQTDKGAQLEMGSRPSLSRADAAALYTAIPDLSLTAPLVVGKAQAVRSNRNWATTVVGATTGYLRAREWSVENGRSFTEREEQEAAPVALLGGTVAQKLFSSPPPAGSVLRLANVPFRIIGVLSTKGLSAAGKDQDDIVVVPLSAAKLRVLGRNHANLDAVDLIVAKVNSADNLASAEQRIVYVLRQRHRLGALKQADFAVHNLAELSDARRETARQFTLLLGSAGAISLLVGGIGIMNMLLVSLGERMREIGVRMAIGASPADICLHFLFEAALLALFGGLLGVAGGIVSAKVAAAIAGWPVLIETNSVVLAIAFTTALGICFGIYPAVRASHLAPSEALRSI